MNNENTDRIDEIRERVKMVNIDRDIYVFAATYKNDGSFLIDTIDRLTAERDKSQRRERAAVEDMRQMAVAWNKACAWCKHAGNRSECASCVRHAFIAPENPTRTEKWQWRGLVAGRGEV